MSAVAPTARRPADRAAIAVLVAACAVFVSIVVLRVAQGGRAGAAAITSPLTGALLAAAAATLLALWRGGLLRNIAAVAVITGAVSLYAGEVVLAARPSDPGRRIAARRGLPYDARARWQLVDSLRAAGVDAWPVMVPALAWGRLRVVGHHVPWPDSVLPLAGIPGVVTVYCREGSQYTIYRSDALGYNNHGAPDSAPAGGIAVLGDSFVHGACVPADSGLVAQLRVMLPAARSFGQDGSGPLMELATLKEVIAPLRPRLVVWTWFEGNDFANLAAERADRRLTAYLDQGIQPAGAPRDSRIMRRWMDSLLVIARTAPRPGVAERVKGVAELRALRQAWQDRRPAAPPTDDDIALLGRVLEVARAETERWGGRLVLAYLPGWHRYFAPDALQPRQDDVLEAARRAGIRVLDLGPAFDAAADKAGLFGYGSHLRGHYSGQGYRLAALGLARGLDSLENASLERPPEGR